MHCLHCAKEIAETFFEALSLSPRARDGRFRCPHCSADHVRREIGRLASGQVEYTVRLWGHPTRFRRVAGK